MKRLPSPDRAAQCPDTAGTDSDSGPLGHIFHNGTGCRIDRIQTVAAFDQYTGTELPGRCPDPRHDRRRQGKPESGNSFIETPDVIEPRFARVARKQAGRHQNIEKLGTFVDFSRHTVLDKIFPFQLLDGSIGKIHVAPVIDKSVHFSEFPGV